MKLSNYSKRSFKILCKTLPLLDNSTIIVYINCIDPDKGPMQSDEYKYHFLLQMKYL